MNIIDTQYSLQTKSLDIYLAGCKGPHCSCCHNQGSWDFSAGHLCTEYWLYDAVGIKVEKFPDLVENIFVVGGEPLDQPDNSIFLLLHELKQYNKPVWLFTRKSLEEVPFFVKEYCTYIKSGRYDETLLTDDNIQFGVKLASSNQKIYKRGVDY